jgi:hypothetical protein
VDDFAEKARVKCSLISAEERVQSFEQVEFAMSAEQAMAEGCRCLKCDLRFNISKSVLPPKQKLWIELTPEKVSQIPEVEGIYELLDEQENIIYIKGAMNLRRELDEQMELYAKARYFIYEEEPMYTKRESQLLQQYIATHGQMPEGNRELEELF